jgi:hypothetical protein
MDWTEMGMKKLKYLINCVGIPDIKKIYQTSVSG